MTIDYGSDVFCDGDDVDWGRESSGSELVLNEIVKRLTTRRGTLIDDEDYGIDLRELYQAEATLPELASLPDRIRNEIAKDDRVLADTILVQVEHAGALDGDMTVRIGGRLSNEESFTLVLSVDSVTVKRLDGGVL